MSSTTSYTPTQEDSAQKLREEFCRITADFILAYKISPAYGAYEINSTGWQVPGVGIYQLSEEMVGQAYKQAEQRRKNGDREHTSAQATVERFTDIALSSMPNQQLTLAQAQTQNQIGWVVGAAPSAAEPQNPAVVFKLTDQVIARAWQYQREQKMGELIHEATLQTIKEHGLSFSDIGTINKSGWRLPSGSSYTLLFDGLDDITRSTGPERPAAQPGSANPDEIKDKLIDIVSWKIELFNMDPLQARRRNAGQGWMVNSLERNEYLNLGSSTPGLAIKEIASIKLSRTDLDEAIHRAYVRIPERVHNLDVLPRAGEMPLRSR